MVYIDWQILKGSRNMVLVRVHMTCLTLISIEFGYLFLSLIPILRNLHLRCDLDFDPLRRVILLILLMIIVQVILIKV